MIDFFHGPEGEALKQVVNVIWSAGYEAYLAGGCVRDYLLNRPFKDIDIATNAKPDVLEKLFPNHIPVGKQFGIIIVLVNSFKFEIATFRTDGEYIDGRHPENISFATSEEDAKRRDFSINALFYDLKKNAVIDFIGGCADLKLKLIRAVGDPNRRFGEDYLRILRALRFRVQLRFDIEPQTWIALSQAVKNLNSISGERISDELFKGLSIDPKLMSDILEASGAWTVLFPYLGTRIPSEVVKINLFESRIESKGEAFAFLILQSELNNKLDAFILESKQKIKWTLTYENMLKEINKQLKLSREDFKILKYLAAANCWSKNWQNLRVAFRYELLAMPENKLLPKLMLAQGLDQAILCADLRLAQMQPQAFLNGTDVVRFDPKQRGSVLKESFYLQWENIISSRSEALKWLDDQYIQLNKSEV